MQLCPCGSNLFYTVCCGRFISHQENPSTPEELMRSRYTAYSQANLDYIRETMKSPAADNFNLEASRERAKKITWVNLKVANSTQDKNTGTVEFYASYTNGVKTTVLHEVSSFILEQGKWYYVSGIFPDKVQPIS